MFATVEGSLGSGDDLRLKDGTFCRIRPLGPNDRDFMLACFDGLSPESRRLRFFGVKPALSAGELDFLIGADGQDHIALGAARLNDQGEEVEPLGAGRCIRLKPGADTGELALAVVDAAQGLGLGTALLTGLVEAARQRGMRRLRCEVLAVNLGMRALAERLGGQVRWLEDGALEYDLRLPEPPPPLPLDPLAGARLGAAVWSSGLERALDGSFLVGRMLLGLWLERWPLGWPMLAETMTVKPRLAQEPA